MLFTVGATISVSFGTFQIHQTHFDHLLFTGYQLNAGSYGQVFKAKHYDENIACKTILLNPRRISRVFYVIDELTILKKLSGHPNISNLIDFHMLSSRHLLIFMELITGGDVRDQLHDMFPDGFSEQVGRNLFRGIANGLHYIHNLGIAHLDLKPGKFQVFSQPNS